MPAHADAPPLPAPLTAPIAEGVTRPTLPRVVLDTQVVMEWLVFRDPGIQPLVSPIEEGRWIWVGSEAMRDELLHVLSRGIAARWNPDPTAVADTFSRLCRMPAPSGHAAPLPLLKCRDKDDQKFIDLALAHRVDALISRDGDVLALAKRARKHGLAILRPEQWLAHVGATEPPAP